VSWLSWFLSKRFRIRLILLLVPVLCVTAYFEAPALHGELRYRLAERARKRRDFADARSYLLANLEADPTSARDHFSLARVARQSGAFEDAEEQLELCKKWEGASPRLAFERQLLSVQQGRFHRLTEIQLRTRLEQGDAESVEILEALSVGCLVNSRFADAHGYLSRWIELAPDNFQAFLWRSTVKDRLSDMTGARDDAARAVALAPANFSTQLNFGQVLLKLTEFQEAEKVFERLAVEYPRDPVIAMGLAQAKSKVHPDAVEAVRILDDLVTRFPDDPPVLFERGRLALQLGETALAESWLRKAAALSPAEYEIQYNLLQSLRQQGKLKEADQVEKTVRRLEEASQRLHELNEQLKKEPYNLALHCAIAQVFLDVGNDRDAVRWLQTALKIDSHQSLANRLLADYYAKSGEPAKAARYREAAQDSTGASSGFDGEFP
jgi:predicted Zn-dependent protease